MKVLLVGSGGREHVLAWKLNQYPRLSKLWIAPGNAGTAALGENVPISAENASALVSFAYSHAIDLYRSTPLMIGEIILVFSVIYHGVNGARIAIFDLFFPHLWEIRSGRKSALWTLAIAILLWLPAAYMMGRAILVHNILR